MYNLLIVDDEALIADSLFQTFQQSKSPEFDVYKAYSGDEALRVFESTRVDIVLSDICMPGMDGLALLAQVRKRWPGCRFVFLTGHTSFEYVYAAIKHKGVSYLLKTDSFDDVIAAVSKAAADLDDELKAANLATIANDQMAKAKASLRDNYLEGIIRGRFSRCDIDQRQFDELELPLRADLPVLILIGRLEGFRLKGKYADIYRRLYRVQATADHFLRPHATGACLIDEHYLLIWLLQPASLAGADADADGSWAELRLFVKGNSARIQEAVNQEIGATLSFALDDGPVGWGSLPERQADLAMLFDCNFGTKSGMLLLSGSDLDAASVPQPQDRSRWSSRKQSLDRLAECLQFGDRDGFFSCFDALMDPSAGIAWGDLDAMELYHGVALALLVHINHRSLAEAVAARIGLAKLMTISAHGDWDGAREYLLRLSRTVFDLNDLEPGETDAIERVKRYISDHIEEPDFLTLTHLADVVRFNPSYLSRLFKQTAGVKISDFLAEARIKKAKILLADGETKVQGIASALGYGTATNFTRFFKKSVGMTPQQYREGLSGKDLN